MTCTAWQTLASSSRAADLLSCPGGCAGRRVRQQDMLNECSRAADAAKHYGTDMAAKKPLIKTTAIQYCLDHPTSGGDDDGDVSLGCVLRHDCMLQRVLQHFLQCRPLSWCSPLSWCCSLP